jgi:hypothetical protein
MNNRESIEAKGETFVGGTASVPSAGKRSGRSRPLPGRADFMSAVSALCAALLIAFAGGLFAAGTGTLDKVSGWYEQGSNLTVTATAANYSVFSGWAGDTNGASISSNTISFAVTAPRSVTAQFSPRLTVTNSVPYQWLADVLGITNGFEAVVTDDPDGDQFTTAEEYWTGTDPMTNTSYLHIASIEAVTTNYRLIWAHAEIGEYLPQVAIQSRASMSSGSWSNVTVRSVTNGVNFWDAPGQLQGFYRLAVTNMPK